MAIKEAFIDFFGSWEAFVDPGPLMLEVLFLIVMLLLVAFFIFEFYKSISKRDLIKLELYKYNLSNHPIGAKIFATLLYLLEYIIIIPFIILLWFTGLAFVLLVITNGKNVQDILLVSAALIGSARVLAYFNKEISQELAKLFPFIALSVFLLSLNNFNLIASLNQIRDTSVLIASSFAYILVVLIIEIALRLLYVGFAFLKSSEENKDF